MATLREKRYVPVHQRCEPDFITGGAQPPAAEPPAAAPSSSRWVSEKGGAREGSESQSGAERQKEQGAEDPKAGQDHPAVAGEIAGGLPGKAPIVNVGALGGVVHPAVAVDTTADVQTDLSCLRPPEYVADLGYAHDLGHARGTLWRKVDPNFEGGPQEKADAQRRDLGRWILGSVNATPKPDLDLAYQAYLANKSV